MSPMGIMHCGGCEHSGGQALEQQRRQNLNYILAGHRLDAILKAARMSRPSHINKGEYPTGRTVEMAVVSATGETRGENTVSH